MARGIFLMVDWLVDRNVKQLQRLHGLAAMINDHETSRVIDKSAYV